MPGAPRAQEFIVPVLVQGSWVQRLPVGGGPVGGQGLMLRVDFREALTVVWCFNVLGPENQVFWLWGGRK